MVNSTRASGNAHFYNYEHGIEKKSMKHATFLYILFFVTMVFMSAVQASAPLDARMIRTCIYDTSKHVHSRLHYIDIPVWVGFPDDVWVSMYFRVEKDRKYSYLVWDDFVVMNGTLECLEQSATCMVIVARDDRERLVNLLNSNRFDTVDTRCSLLF